MYVFYVWALQDIPLIRVVFVFERATSLRCVCIFVASESKL